MIPKNKRPQQICRMYFVVVGVALATLFFAAFCIGLRSIGTAFLKLLLKFFARRSVNAAINRKRTDPSNLQLPTYNKVDADVLEQQRKVLRRDAGNENGSVEVGKFYGTVCAIRDWLFPTELSQTENRLQAMILDAGRYVSSTADPKTEMHKRLCTAHENWLPSSWTEIDLESRHTPRWSCYVANAFNARNIRLGLFVLFMLGVFLTARIWLPFFGVLIRGSTNIETVLDSGNIPGHSSVSCMLAKSNDDLQHLQKCWLDPEHAIDVSLVVNRPPLADEIIGALELHREYFANRCDTLPKTLPRSFVSAIGDTFHRVLYLKNGSPPYVEFGMLFVDRLLEEAHDWEIDHDPEKSENSNHCLCAPHFGVMSDLWPMFDRDSGAWRLLVLPQLQYNHSVYGMAKSRISYDATKAFPHVVDSALVDREAIVHHKSITVESLEIEQPTPDDFLPEDDRNVAVTVGTKQNKATVRLSGFEAACFFHCSKMQSKLRYYLQPCQTPLPETQQGEP